MWHSLFHALPCNIPSSASSLLCPSSSSSSSSSHSSLYYNLRDLMRAFMIIFCFWVVVSVSINVRSIEATPTSAAEEMSGLENPRYGLGGNRRPSLISDPFQSNKRRVPNGPDPIHNRKAGKFIRPPAKT